MYVCIGVSYTPQVELCSLFSSIDRQIEIKTDFSSDLFHFWLQINMIYC